MRVLLLSAAVGLLASAYALGDAPVWTVMDDSRLGYSLYLGDDEIGGEFTVFDAHIQFDPEMLATSHFVVSVKPEFVDSQVALEYCTRVTRGEGEGQGQRMCLVANGKLAQALETISFDVLKGVCLEK